jgi:hypothetical protein
MRQLTENEVRRFYVAYLAMEASAHTLKNEAERFHREADWAKELARRYSMAARRFAVERDLVLVTLLLGVVGCLMVYLALALYGLL